MTTNLAASLGGLSFRTILADPPWQYKTYAGVGIPSRIQHYPTLSLEQLCAMPVSMVAQRDCVLVMWTISSHIDQALLVGKAWGFEYKTLGFIWDKGKMSFGKWVRQEAEISLIFTRGKPSRSVGGAGTRQMIRGVKPTEHSKKPMDAMERLERMHPGPYLELFSRSTRPGWTAWGNEADLFGVRGPEVVG